MIQFHGLPEFQKTIRDFEKSLKPKVYQATAEIAEDLVRRAINNTPVVTGKLRGNWDISFDGMDRTTEYPTDKGGGRTAGRIYGKLRAFKPPFTRIRLTNIMPYAYTVEFGVSEDGSRVISYPRAYLRRAITSVKAKWGFK